MRSILLSPALIFSWTIYADAQIALENNATVRTDSRIESIVAQIDSLDYRIGSTEQRIDDSLSALRTKVDGFGDLSRQLRELRSELSKVYELRGQLQSNQEASADLLMRLSAAETRVETNALEVLRAKDNSESIIWIISVVSAIASGLVLLVSLFFSKRFMDLYADAKVSRALLERLQGQIDDDSNQATVGQSPPSSTS